MQSKGGGKHDILSVGRGNRDQPRMSVNEAPRSRCGHVPRRGNGAGEHGGVHGASELRVRYRSPWRPIRLWRRHARVVAGLWMLKRWRSSWPANEDQAAQLAGQDKANWRSRSLGSRRGHQVSVCTLSFARKRRHQTGTLRRVPGAASGRSSFDSNLKTGTVAT
jgi:hypothetical protein